MATRRRYHVVDGDTPGERATNANAATVACTKEELALTRHVFITKELNALNGQLSVIVVTMSAFGHELRPAEIVRLKNAINAFQNEHTVVCILGCVAPALAAAGIARRRGFWRLWAIMPLAATSCRCADRPRAAGRGREARGHQRAHDGAPPAAPRPALPHGSRSFGSRLPSSRGSEGAAKRQ